MTTVGSLGIGSGMDLNGLLDKLQSAESAPLKAITAKQAAYTSKLSAFGTLRGLLSAFKGAADKLGDTAFLGAFKTASSNAGVLTTASDSTAAAGTYSVEVSQLAAAQSLATAGQASATQQIGSGAATIVIDFGSVAGTLDPAGSGTFAAGATFTADASRKQIRVDLVNGKTSLSQVRDAINAAAGTALSASIINDGSGSRLVLTGRQTGATSDMKITVSDGNGGAAANAALAALLGNDPAGTQALRQTVAGQDASLTVNGIAVHSARNAVAGAIQGVTLNLLAAGSSTVSVDRDTASVKGALGDFVSAYNNLAATSRRLGAYAIGGAGGGPLAGDSTLRMIQDRLRAAMFTARAGQPGDPTRLSDVGIAFQKDGSLSIVGSKLDAMLASNPDALARLLAGDSTVPGIAKQLSGVVDAFTADNIDNAKDGLLTIATDGVKKASDRMSVQYQTESDRIDARMQVYRAQFTQLDKVMSGLTATSSYLTTQFAALAGTKSQ